MAFNSTVNFQFAKWSRLLKVTMICSDLPFMRSMEILRHNVGAIILEPMISTVICEANVPKSIVNNLYAEI